MLNKYIKKNKDDFHILRKQNFFWRNVNFEENYNKIKNFYEKK